jgi:hypothetical protein
VRARRRAPLSWVVAGGFALMLVAPDARASRWMVGGSALISRPDDGGQTYFSKLGFGAGLLFSVPLAKMLELEADAFYFRRKFGAGSASNTYLFTADYVQVPLIARITFFDLLSFGAGAYYSYFPGKISVETSFGNFEGDPVRNYDYGYLFSARVGGTLQSPVFIEYRYAQGLTNVVNTGSAKYFEVQFTLGLALNRSR